MADNVNVTEGSGAIVAADEISGIKHQRVKLQFGADGSATDASAADPLPVTISGGATAANQATANTALAAIQTAVEALDNTVGGSELQVDVVTSALPTGAATAANQTTEIASLATLAGHVDGLETLVTSTNTKLDTVNTNLGTIDGRVDAVETKLDSIITNTAAATPAGTNNIGDVDIATIAAGETHIGQVGTDDTVIEITLTLDTSAYTSGDVLADTQAIANAARVNAGSVVLESITVIDEDDQKQAFTLIFMDTNNSLGTENSAPNISDANARQILGFVKVVAGDYIDLGGVSIASLRSVGLQLKAAAATTTIYVAVLSDGTGTYTASGLRIKFGFLRA